MSFTDHIFFLFLPLVFAVYWFALGRSRTMQNLFLVAASYFFYGFVHWRWLLLIGASSLCSYGAGMMIERGRGCEKRALLANAANITVNLGILCLFKYYNFFVSAFAEAFHMQPRLLPFILPVGISFYTLQAISYTIDVYRGKVDAEKNIITLFAYLSFFPQLIAGPIERAGHLLSQFRLPRKLEYNAAADGLRMALWGYFKKVVIADGCAYFTAHVFASWQTQDASSLLLGAVLFSFQIYCDFSGYSDIAVGLARLFGIRLRQNFATPFFSRNIGEFWRRWHISLTSWFRDYVYFPLGGSRCRKGRVVFNTAVVFLLSGLWHGANWTYMAWGAFHATLFVPLILGGKSGRYRDVPAAGRKLPSWKESLQMTLTFFLFVLSIILFRSQTLAGAWGYFSGLFSWDVFNAFWRFFALDPVLVVSIPLLLVVDWIDRDQPHALQMRGIRPRVLRYVIYALLLSAIILCFSGNAPKFIYFQF